MWSVPDTLLDSSSQIAAKLFTFHCGEASLHDASSTMLLSASWTETSVMLLSAFWTEIPTRIMNFTDAMTLFLIHQVDQRKMVRKLSLQLVAVTKPHQIYRWQRKHLVVWRSDAKVWSLVSATFSWHQPIYHLYRPVTRYFLQLSIKATRVYNWLWAKSSLIRHGSRSLHHLWGACLHCLLEVAPIFFRVVLWCLMLWPSTSFYTTKSFLASFRLSRVVNGISGLLRRFLPVRLWLDQSLVSL